MRHSAVLFDLDGTIYQKGELIPGVCGVLLLLQKAKIPYRFITNTTRMSSDKLSIFLSSIGCPILPGEIFTTPRIAAMYCKERGYKKIQVTVIDNTIKDDFSEFDLVNEQPDAIILGDMGEQFTFKLMNRLFNQILLGAELVALHKNRFWLSERGYMLDIGSFVASLEFATETSAVIIGKPSRNLFQLACLGWDVPANKILMVGDDMHADIGGALNVGMQSALVKTGKFLLQNNNDFNYKPHYIIDSVADLPDILNLKR